MFTPQDGKNFGNAIVLSIVVGVVIVCLIGAVIGFGAAKLIGG